MPGQKAGEAIRREQLLRAAFHVAAARGLEGLTIRAVAARAGLSHGLVHFHFRRKADLVAALLEWLLETTGAFQAAAPARDATPADALIALLAREMERLAADRQRIHLFFDFWLLGTRERRIRERMCAELERYRAALRPMTEAVLRADPARFPGVTPDALAAVVVAFVKGSAVQLVIDPSGFDMEAFATAASALLAQPDMAVA